MISKDGTETLVTNDKDHGLDFHLRALLEINHQVAHIVGDELDRLGLAKIVDVVNERTGRTVRGIHSVRVPENIELLREVILGSVASPIAAE